MYSGILDFGEDTALFILYQWLKEDCYEQESSAFREIPVVIMSSENILARIDRYI